MGVAERLQGEARRLQEEWASQGRWRGVDRPYAAEDVVRLRGSVTVEHTLAFRGAARLWHMLRGDEHIPALGALSGAQAVQMVKAGLRSIYVSGWQVAGANLTATLQGPTTEVADA